jgi:hypothetical protein
VHESLKDKIEFNGVRYSVGLPWKRAHKPLPWNYDCGVVEGAQGG